MIIHQRICALPVAFLLWLAVAPAQAGCSVVQTAGNEIVIKSSIGGCDTAALRAVLSSALADPAAGTSPLGGERPGLLADIRRSAGQGALWRMANMNNQAPLTRLTMPRAH